MSAYLSAVSVLPSAGSIFAVVDVGDALVGGDAGRVPALPVGEIGLGSVRPFPADIAPDEGS